MLDANTVCGRFMGRQRVRRTIVVSQITDSDKFEAGLSEIADNPGGRGCCSRSVSVTARRHSGPQTRGPRQTDDPTRSAWTSADSLGSPPSSPCPRDGCRILLVQGYIGYALVTFAVAASRGDQPPVTRRPPMGRNLVRLQAYKSFDRSRRERLSLASGPTSATRPATQRQPMALAPRGTAGERSKCRFQRG